jgi:hypothetical protein
MNPLSYSQKVPILIFCILLLTTAFATAQPMTVYEIDDGTKPLNEMDRLVLASQKELGIEAAYLCSDAVFIRRVYIDLTGTIPPSQAVKDFLADNTDGKRERLVDSLIGSDDFVNYWSLKWSDVLRVKAEFPINLWPNGVHTYYRYIHESIKHNKPYDQFVRELLTSNGSNFRTAPVNFYCAIQGQEPSTIAGAVALTMMGSRFDDWPQAKRKEMEAFFSRVGYKGTAEWKETIIHLDPTPVETIQTKYPDGQSVKIKPDQDPRVVFADWLIRADNDAFTQSIVNRQWAWLMGRGIVEEADDFRSDNPPSNPALLNYLAKELVKSDYDLRHVMRLILNSRTYQQSFIPRSKNPKAEAMFAFYPARQLDAEILQDALNGIYGGNVLYSSMVPEPFTFVPEEHRTIELRDGSINSPFLEMFGRPSRDTGLMSERNNTPTDSQRLFLLNASQIQKQITVSPKLRRLNPLLKKDRDKLVMELYVMLLSREATEVEKSAALAYMDTPHGKGRNGLLDLAWALTNSKEFLFRH